ncbi:uncharacterized protein J8A68_003317 [[Candida] subhashii]|uniref:DUF1682-domain-containing protein n=1 Tax=[Candida] subhashii TaxID=561895 RepID=A0A8J5UYJ9_9ASCO|nr:uncharacterized protein J8A68_003317 [[Candida] subhashii]KAG7663139.1 hypothetical protein J8A68_003317 [[Candida] subhashii]
MLFEHLSRLLPAGMQGGVSDYSDFTVEELTAMSIWQRLAIRDWRLELFTVGFIAIFALLFKAGDFYNQSKVTSFLKKLKPVLERNFYQVGVGEGKLYIKDNAEAYSSYATGRSNIAKVDIKLNLVPRENLFVWILESVLSFFSATVKAPEDIVEFTITPSIEYDNFIAAIVSKLGMNEARKLNYFLSLCKTSDSPNLPESFVYMSEANEFQEKITTNELKNALTLKSASFIKLIAITDQPVEKPENIRELYPRRRIVVSCNITNNAANIKVIEDVLDALFSFVDKLANKQITFRPEAVKRVVKTRETEIEKIRKVHEEAQKEKLAEEKAKQKREERDKLRALSREEQIKLEKKAQEKQQKKLQRKQKVKM